MDQKPILIEHKDRKPFADKNSHQSWGWIVEFRMQVKNDILIGYGGSYFQLFVTKCHCRNIGEELSVRRSLLYVTADLLPRRSVYSSKRHLFLILVNG
jgi:hypothetical protein